MTIKKSPTIDRPGVVVVPSPEGEGPRMHEPDDDGPGVAAVIARRLDHLIETENTRRRATGQAPVTYRELAERSNEHAAPGRAIGKDVIHHLHRGRNGDGRATNPTVETLNAIGRAFKIANGAAYFVSPDTTVVDQQLRILDDLLSMRTDGDTAVGAMFRTGAPVESVQLVSKLADRLRAINEAYRQPE